MMESLFFINENKLLQNSRDGNQQQLANMHNNKLIGGKQMSPINQ